MDTKQHSLSVLMFPWLAHGHISPFLELAKKLSKMNFYIYLCSTPINLSSVKAQISEQLFPSIQLVELHIPAFPNLPPHYHTTKGLPPHLMTALKEAFDTAEPTFSYILKTLKPDILIYDYIQLWAPVVASSQNIPAIQFLSNAAAACCFLFHATKNPSVEFPFSTIYIREDEHLKITRLLESSTNDLKDKDRFIQSLEESSNIILIKTFREIEAKYIDFLSVLTGKKIVPVGPLVQESKDDDDNQKKFIQWLDKKDQSSVVFVSFGSEYFLSKEEMKEIAHGLELSKVNFIWVVRFPGGETIGVDEALPQGFIERVGERGMVVEGWAPQAKILRNSSIGGFVSHCGWSSVMEGMKFGVPIIAMPMHLDQPLNARLVVEIGVGVEVEREKDGRLERGEVARVIKEVVMEKEGEGVRRKARELSEKLRKKGEEEIDGVVEELVQLCRKE